MTEKHLRDLRSQLETAEQAEQTTYVALCTTARNYSEDGVVSDLSLTEAARRYTAAYDWSVWCSDQVEEAEQE